MDIVNFNKNKIIKKNLIVEKRGRKMRFDKANN